MDELDIFVKITGVRNPSFVKEITNELRVTTYNEDFRALDTGVETEAKDLSLFTPGFAAELLKDNSVPLVTSELANYSLKVSSSSGIEISDELVIDFPPQIEFVEETSCVAYLEE